MLYAVEVFLQYLEGFVPFFSLLGEHHYLNPSLCMTWARFWSSMHIFKGQILITLLGLNQSNLSLLKLMLLWFQCRIKIRFYSSVCVLCTANHCQHQRLICLLFFYWKESWWLLSHWEPSGFSHQANVGTRSSRGFFMLTGQWIFKITFEKFTSKRKVRKQPNQLISL